MRKLLSFVGIFLMAFGAEAAFNIPEEVEFRAINECLESFGGLTLDLSQRLQRYKQWSDTYEEIPCFTKCYLSKVLPDVYNETYGFQQQNVMTKFGPALVNACASRLSPVGRPTTADACSIAYSGFHCLVSLENDPFILIESMDHLSTEAKDAMKDCLRKFDQYEWERFSEYPKFPVREPIPCFTKCFLNKLHMFDERHRSWHMDALQAKLGVPVASADYSHCTALRRRRNRNNCQWMYNEFTCFVMAK